MATGRSAHALPNAGTGDSWEPRGAALNRSVDRALRRWGELSLSVDHDAVVLLTMLGMCPGRRGTQQRWLLRPSERRPM